MESRPQSYKDLRSSTRYNTSDIPLSLISNDFHYDIPARLNNVSLGGIQILCSHFAIRELSRPRYSSDDSMNILVKIHDKDDSKSSELSCKLIYTHRNYSPNKYCSDAVGFEVLMDNPENRQLLSRIIKRNT